MTMMRLRVILGRFLCDTHRYHCSITTLIGISVAVRVVIACMFLLYRVLL